MISSSKGWYGYDAGIEGILSGLDQCPSYRRCRKTGNGDSWWGLMEEVTERGRWPQLCGATLPEFCSLKPSRAKLPLARSCFSSPICSLTLEKLPIWAFLPGCPRVLWASNNSLFVPTRLGWRARELPNVHLVTEHAIPPHEKLVIGQRGGHTLI
jgi:hypothetical protein